VNKTLNDGQPQELRVQKHKLFGNVRVLFEPPKTPYGVTRSGLLISGKSRRRREGLEEGGVFGANRDNNFDFATLKK
jgi:hypothetical protein